MKDRISLPALVLLASLFRIDIGGAQLLSYTVVTLAGTPTAGNVDGTKSESRFNGPSGVAFDAAGDLYIADTWNCTIRKVTTNGVVTTLAGSPGNPGGTDGSGSIAQFYYPVGLAIDNSGVIYVADAGNSTIRKVTPTAEVTTLAGLAGNFSHADGAGTEARFDGPSCVTIDGTGNIYLADSGNATIRKVTPEGLVTTIAGLPRHPGNVDGPVATAQFNFPTGLSVDSAGNIYVADLGNSAIRKITAGMVTTVTELTVSSPIAALAPTGVVLDGAGNTYVVDNASSFILKRTKAGTVTNLVGKNFTRGSADGSSDVAQFNRPYGIAVNAAGVIHIADFGNNTIRKVTPSGSVSTLAGLARNSSGVDGTGSAARFKSPRTLAVDSAGIVYVADSFNETIRKITPDGAVTTLAGVAGKAGSRDGTALVARFRYPSGVAVGPDGNVYVADLNNHTIRKVTPQGSVTTLAGLAGTQGSQDGPMTDARFSYPAGVAVDRVGNIYVADQGNRTIRKVTLDAKVITLAGSAGATGNSDGIGAAARFAQPCDLTVDSFGNIYVADSRNHTIRKVTPAGAVTTLPGIFGDACASSPEGVSVDSDGNVYVADSCDSVIWSISPAGVVTALAGLAPTYFDEPVGGSADGIGVAARFYQPRGIATDGRGNIYVADTGNSTIRKGVRATTSPSPQR